MALLAETTRFPIDPSTTLVGRSRAGDATAFAIPELKWLFDCGTRVQPWKPHTIFLTHTHSDHVHHLFRFREKDRPPTIYLPKAGVPFVEACLKAYQEMIDCESSTNEPGETPTQADYILRATQPNEEFVVSQGGNKFVVRTLSMDHRIPCLGYSIFKLQSRLKDEYKGRNDIRELRKSGVQVTTTEEKPLFCFLGDTTASVFEQYPELPRQHSVVVVECSFIDDQSKERATITKHMHWDDLQPIVAAHPATMFVLIHFSLKYSALKLRNFFREQQYDNIHPMLVEREVEEQWKATGEEGPCPTCRCRVCLKT